VLLVALGVLLAPGVLLVPLGVLLVGGVLVCCAMALVSARPLTAATTMNRLSMGTLLLDGKLSDGRRRPPASCSGNVGTRTVFPDCNCVADRCPADTCRRDS
jgi:hypothetical protein